MASTVLKKPVEEVQRILKTKRLKKRDVTFEFIVSAEAMEWLKAGPLNWSHLLMFLNVPRTSSVL
jgi:hypothetical protein